MCAAYHRTGVTFMSTSSVRSTSQYEFDESQNQTIGLLARRMGLVGVVMIVFGLLQMINGVSSMIMSRNPDRMLAAAEKAGMPPEQLDVLKKALAGGWSSPLTVSALAFAAAGLLLLLIGAWTRQAAGGFASIVQTKGQDVSRSWPRCRRSIASME